MANNKAYEITYTQPTVYLDKAGQAVNGYLVTFTILEFDEVHQVKVPSLAPEVVKPAVETVIKQRKALSELGA